MADPNVELLTRLVEALGDLNERLVFVGGCATGLLISDPAAAPVRATGDVDAIVAITSMRDYVMLGKDLRKRGFSQTLAAGDPPYRWTCAGLKLDLMPVDDAVLGFSNRWYEQAMATASVIELRPDLNIRVVTAPCFIATKLEAFLDRGKGDYLGSHDLEDVIMVVDGRPELVAEVGKAATELRTFIAEKFSGMLADPEFMNVLPGLVIDGSPMTRLSVVVERLRAIANLPGPGL